MKELGKWQTVSFLSRMVSQIIGLVSSVIIPTILTVGEFGLISLANSIGKTFGVTQNLGLASGSTREMSKSTNSHSDLSKILFTSILIKYVISFPLAFGLFLFAEKLAIGKYSAPEVVLPLRIFAVILVVQNIQSLFNSLIQAMQRFKLLFTYQIVIAVLNVCIFIPLVYLYRAIGYFYASLIFNTLASIFLGIIALYPLRNSFALPTKDEFKEISKAVFVVSLGVYAVKIIFTFWEGIGPLVLGLHLDTTQIGYFSLALFYCAKLMTVSDSVTDVNLSVFSKQYSLNSTEFKKLFIPNYNKLFVIVTFISLGALFWKFEVITLFFKDKYLDSVPLILPIMLGYVLYSFVNIFKSSIFVPAKLMPELILSYSALLTGTVGSYYLLFKFMILDRPLLAMSIALFIGSLLCFLLMAYFGSKRLSLNFITPGHVILLLFVLFSAKIGILFDSYIMQLSVTWYLLVSKLFIFLLYVGMFLYTVLALKFISLAELKSLLRLSIRK